MRAPAEACVSDKQWAEPQDNWMPLRQAVFVFGMTEDEKAPAIHDQPILGLSEDDFDPESRRRELSKKLESETNDSEIAERATAPFSRRQLTKMLQGKSGAHSAEIDPNTSTFLFDFRNASGGATSSTFGPPWAFLEERNGDHCPKPQWAAEALFNREGSVRIPDE